MTIRLTFKSTFKNRKKTRSLTSDEVVFYMVSLGTSDFSYKSYKFYSIMLEESKDSPHKWFSYTKTFIESSVLPYQIHAKANGLRKTCDIEIYTNKYNWKDYLTNYHFLSKMEKAFLDEYKDDVFLHTGADEFKKIER